MGITAGVPSHYLIFCYYFIFVVYITVFNTCLSYIAAISVG